MLLPLATEPFTAPTDRDMLPSERREFVRTHRTCVYGYRRRHDGPAMSVVYYVPTDDDELLVSTMAPRGKARAVARDGKVSLCVLDERWPFVYLQVYADAVIDRDRDLVVDVMMAVAGRMSGQPLGDEARPYVAADGGPRGSSRRADRPAQYDAGLQGCGATELVRTAVPTDNPADPADQPRDRRRTVPERTHRGMAPITRRTFQLSRPGPSGTRLYVVTVAIPHGVRA